MIGGKTMKVVMLPLVLVALWVLLSFVWLAPAEGPMLALLGLSFLALIVASNLSFWQYLYSREQPAGAADVSAGAGKGSSARAFAADALAAARATAAKSRLSQVMLPLVLVALWVLLSFVWIAPAEGPLLAIFGISFLGLVVASNLSYWRYLSRDTLDKGSAAGRAVSAGKCVGDGAAACEARVSAKGVTAKSRLSRPPDPDEDDDGFVSCEEEDLEGGAVGDEAAPGSQPRVAWDRVPWSQEEWAAEGLGTDPALVEELRRSILQASSTPTAGADCEAPAAASSSASQVHEDELRRLLLANGENVKRATRQYFQAAQARERAAAFAAGAGREAVAAARRAGLCFLLPEGSVDRRGHPTMVFNGAAHDPQLFGPDVVTSLMMQVAAEAETRIRGIQRERQVAKAVLIFYIARGTPMDLSAYSTMISTLTTAFPEALWRCLVCPVGGKVPWLYGLVKPFIPTSLQAAVTFVAPGKWRRAEFRAEMSTYFSMEVLPETFGGNLPWWPEGAKGRKERWPMAGAHGSLDSKRD